jgi:hypothetical protein
MAVPIGETSSSLEGSSVVEIPVASFLSSTFLITGAVAARDTLEATGTMVTELAAEAVAEETVDVVMAAPNCTAGIAGTGGIPAGRELVRGEKEVRMGAGAGAGVGAAAF